MIKTLMRGLVEKDMQAVINTYDLKPLLLSYAFPVEGNLYLDMEGFGSAGRA